MRAWVVTKDEPKLELREVPEPQPLPSEALVQLKATSLNRGEVRRVMTTHPVGFRPGWDVAGVVLAQAADGSGPPKGTRVVGLMPHGAWAERAAVSTSQLAALPDPLSFEAASVIPVAGLTALRALAIGGLLLGKRVLVTGASGGVGRLAVQLAKRSGAHVTAVVHSEKRGEGLRELGAEQVVVGLEASGPKFDVVLESVGGSLLAAALQRLERDAVIVTYGNTSAEPTSFLASSFYPTSGARMQGFFLFHELERTAGASRDLATLAALLAEKKLDPQIDRTLPWTQLHEAVRALLGREIAGKAVLTFD